MRNGGIPRFRREPIQRCRVPLLTKQDLGYYLVHMNSEGRLMSKYRPLTEFLEQKSTETVRLTFDEIARMIGQPLPRSAFEHREWWSNNPSGHSHARAWVDAGWRSEQVDMSGRSLVFRRMALEDTMQDDEYDLWGAMRGSVTVQPGWDLTQPTGEEWDAESGKLCN